MRLVAFEGDQARTSSGLEQRSSKPKPCKPKPCSTTVTEVTARQAHSPRSTVVAPEVRELLQAWVAVSWQHLTVGVDVNALQNTKTHDQVSLLDCMEVSMPCNASQVKSNLLH